jgi:hypothetical protein
MAKRPTFRKTPASGSTGSPEELFYSLTGRAKTHGYLRGPQQDALREYLAASKQKDVAFELPTGAGKTMVGLLIAEWLRRKSSGRAAFLTLNNQLAGQVIEEAKRLALPVADLRGNKERRSASEESKFLDGSAIAVSTYSNLFNSNPIIKECHALVLDDAHGGGEFASSMWTLRVIAPDNGAIFGQIVATLKPLMTEGQIAEVFDPQGSHRVAIVDLGVIATAKEQLAQILERLPAFTPARYAWNQIRANLHACHVFISKDSLAIRPYIVPTYEHVAFASVQHRIYLSATLGDVEDLRRAYAVDKIEAVRAAKEQDGRRFVFVPGLGMGGDEVRAALRSIWGRLEPRRAVAIAPSFPSLTRLQVELVNAFGASNFHFFGAQDIEESLTPFTGASNAVLALANRYDGLDLPDDDCRLLILADSPRATNELENNLSSAWKLGPALRWREATRLVQGMGRCTRSATDFAVILLLGESLINAATNMSLLRLLPPTLRREIQWGRTQIKESGLTPEAFAEMVVALISDESYRREADESIADSPAENGSETTGTRMAIATKEVAHSKAFWAGDYSRAQEVASEIVDMLSGEEWAGFRAWWLYSASLAARHAGNLTGELAALKRAKATGINAGWLDHLLRSRQRGADPVRNGGEELPSIVAEKIWNAIDELGWSGRRFADYCEKMLSDVMAADKHKTFHAGLEALGRLLGAQASRPSNQGEPDVIWQLGDHVWICFEAKTEKLSGGAGLSKKDVLQAKGHVDWARFFATQGARRAEIFPVIVAPTAKIDPIAEPHKESLYFLSVLDISEWAKKVHKGLIEVRTKYSGQDFAAARTKFARDLEQLGLDSGATLSLVRSKAL